MTILPLYKCLVRSHFDYAISVWDPYKVKHITDIEDVQRRATKLIPEIKKNMLSGKTEKTEHTNSSIYKYIIYTRSNDYDRSLQNYKQYTQ